MISQFFEVQILDGHISTLPSQRRLEIIEIARRFNVQIIEDDAYAGMTETTLPSLTSLGPERVTRIIGVSKTLGPGLRVGYLEMPPQFTAKLAAVMHGTSIMASPISAGIVSHLIEGGDAERILRENRDELAKRNLVVDRHLSAFGVRTARYCPHAWLELPVPWTKDDFVNACSDNGILVLSSDVSAVDRNNIDHAVRVSVSAARSITELDTVARRIGEILSVHVPFSAMMS